MHDLICIGSISWGWEDIDYGLRCCNSGIISIKIV